MLHDAKVTLRAITRADLPRLNQFENDVVHFTQRHDGPWEPQALERQEAQFAAQLQIGATDGPIFAIEADAQCIGTCLLHQFDMLAQQCQIGLGIGDPAYRDKGYGSATIRLLLDYAFRIRNMRRVYLAVLANNSAAIQAYQRCGFVEEGRLRQHAWYLGAYVDLVYMGLLRTEWAK